MSTTLDRRRREIAREVAALLAASPEVRRALNAIPEQSGGSPIIIATTGDEMGVIFERLRTDYPKGAYVATKERGKSKPTFISMRPIKGGYSGVDEADPHPINSRTKLSMLLTYLHRQRGPIMCHEVQPDMRDMRCDLVGAVD